MPRKRILLTPLIALLLSEPCLAADPGTGRRAMCGEYSYVLPEGFVETHMPQPFPGCVYLNRREHDAYAKGNRGVTCIEKENTDGQEFMLESVEFIIDAIPQLKDDHPVRIFRYVGDMPDRMRLYTLDRLYGVKSKTEMSFAACLLEVGARNSKTHTILYVWDRRPPHAAQGDPRPYARIAEDDNEVKKERVMRILRSVQEEPQAD